MAAKKKIFDLVCQCGRTNDTLKIFLSLINLITYVDLFSPNYIKFIGILFAIITEIHNFSKINNHDDIVKT